MWAANSLDGTVSWISPATNQEVERIPVGNGPTGVCVAGGVVWIAVSDDHASCASIRSAGARRRSSWTTCPRSWPAAAVRVGQQRVRGDVTQSAPLDGGVVSAGSRRAAARAASRGARGRCGWPTPATGTVSRIDPRRGAPTAAIPWRSTPGRCTSRSARTACGSATRPQERVARIDPARQAVVTAAEGRQPAAGPRRRGRIAVGGCTRVRAQHRGGTLRILDSKREVSSPGGRLDPAASTTGGGTHPRLDQRRPRHLPARRRAAGSTLVAGPCGVAAPPTDRGRTYAFQLRRGISTRRARRCAPRTSGASSSVLCDKGVAPEGFYGGIRGAKACAARHADCDLSPGIRVDDAAGTITFRLTAADPDFLYKLAQTLAVPVPPGTSVSALRKPLPATGPYQVAGARSQAPATGTQPAVSPDRRQASRLCRRDQLRLRRRSARGDPCGPARACGPRGHRGPQRRAAGAARRDRDAVRRTAARRRAAPHQLHVPQHARSAVQPPRRAPRAELRRRPPGRRRRPWRGPLRPGHLPDPAAQLPRLPALLPLHAQAPAEAGRGPHPTSRRRGASSPARTHGAWR